MPVYFLAVDIGASGGRHMLGWVEDGICRTEEIYRFQNGFTEKSGVLCWDIDALYEQTLCGIEACLRRGIVPHSIGVDTWAVDFVLLDENDRPVGDAVCYRDSRTNGMAERLAARLPDAALYARTGIQKQAFNTIYQLMALREQHPEQLARAKRFLMMPDYLHFRLSGRAACEYTNATTTQLVSAQTGTWDAALLAEIGVDPRLFPEILPPQTTLGGLCPALKKRFGADMQVVLPPTHDTASAVLGSLTRTDEIYISSGTWSLMGVTIPQADCSTESRRLNFTNEGGVGGFRYLKNIMGLWMLQSVRRELAPEMPYAELERLSRAEVQFPARVDVNDDRFFAPDSMTAAIRAVCRETGQPVPRSIGEFGALIYHSLAESYAATAAELERVRGRRYETINIVGGGSEDGFLNALTARASGKRVLAGPKEATAAGNLIAQMCAAGVVEDLDAAKRMLWRSFPIHTYKGVTSDEATTAVLRCKATV